MMERVAAAVTETVVVTVVEATVAVSVVMVLDVDGHVLLHVHGIGHGVRDRDFDRHFDRVRHRPVDVHRYVFLHVHRVRDRFLDVHRVRHVFLDRHDDRPVHHDRHLFGDVHGAHVSVAVVRSQQTVVGQAVPFAVAAVPVAQTPKASFALFLFRRRLLRGVIGSGAD